MLQITPDERLAIQLLAEGKSRTELAVGLSLTEGEVDEHLTALFGRIGVETSVEAIALGVKRGLVEPWFSNRDCQVRIGDAVPLRRTIGVMKATGRTNAEVPRVSASRDRPG